jgi:glucans biosynthesis protein
VRTASLKQAQFRLYLKRGGSALSETVIKAIET